MLVSARYDDDIERTKCRQQIEFGYDGSYLLFRSVDGNIRLLVYQHFLRPYRKPQDQVCGYFVQLFGSALTLFAVGDLLDRQVHARIEFIQTVDP
ncbi:hypothetical protein LMG22931_03234 [Paraburkholderia nemoris]|nr:hypothetical protein LMG22931_03234 [Paraburkholderia nemoris]